MSGLFQTLSVGAESLAASRQGVDTTGHNIANVHTEGYSRQRVNLAQRDPVEARGLVIGNGAYVKNIARAHDPYVEKEILQAKQVLGKCTTQQDQLKKIEGIFSPESGANINNELTKFFNSLQDLSQFPEELIVRTSVKDAGQNLASAFKRVDNDLRGAQRDINDSLNGEVSEINVILENVAKLNLSIAETESVDGRIANDLRDKQDSLLRDLADRIDVRFYSSDQGMVTVRGPQETLLVDHGFCAQAALLAKPGMINAPDFCIIEKEDTIPKVVTNINKNGRVAALVNVRDKTINQMLNNNNEMAGALAENVNQIHRQGFGINDFGKLEGRNFFAISDDPNQAASSIDITQAIAENTDAISAAGTPDAPGDNIVVNNLLRLEHERIMEHGRSTLGDYYSNFVGVFGLDIVRNNHQTEANQILLNDLNARREAIAGVSLDEEAMNLMRWQANFTASSRVITTVDEMLDTVLSLKR